MIILISGSLSEKPNVWRETNSAIQSGSITTRGYIFSSSFRHLYSSHVDRFLSQDRMWCQYIYLFPGGGGGTAQKVMRGSSTPDLNPPSAVIHHFWHKYIPSTRKQYPYQILTLEMHHVFLARIQGFRRGIWWHSPPENFKISSPWKRYFCHSEPN